MHEPRIAIPADTRPLTHADRLAPVIRAANHELRRTTLEETGLPITEIEVIRLRLAQLNGCRTCTTYRMITDDPEKAQGFEERLTPRFYDAVLTDGDPTILSPRERLLWEFCEAFARDHYALDDADDQWTAMRQLFDDAAIVEAVMTIASFDMSGKFNHVLGLDEPFCEIS